MSDRNHNLSQAEVSVLRDGADTGVLTARLYRDGVFSEPDFIHLGVLQRLAIRGRIAFVEFRGGQTDAAYTYRLVGDRAYAPELDRDAA